MSVTYGKDDKSAIQAKFDAQKISFGPVMFHAAKLLRDLGILKTIIKNRKGITLDEIAKQLNLSRYGVKILLEAGLSLELVCVKNDLYYITKTGYFILNDDLTRVNMDFTNDVNYLGMFKLKESIINHEPEGLKIFGDWNTIYEALTELPDKVQESWYKFDHYYSDYAFPEILPVVFEDKPRKILDVGGNTGKFAIKCAEYDDNVEITILDLPGQINDALKNIRKNNMENRINTHTINLLDHSKPFPEGADVIWMSQFLDCFSQDDIYELLLRSYKAMSEDSSLFILETYWDKQRFKASTYSLHATSLYFACIANGCSQMYHSEDLLNLIDKANMKVVKEINDVGVSHTLFKCKKK